MNIYKINNLLLKIFLFLILISNISCSRTKNNDDNIFEEINFDHENIIEKGNFKFFNIIENYWAVKNQKSYIFNYEYSEYAKIKFGEGKNKKNFMISNPILIGDHIFLIDNTSILTKYNIVSKGIEWEKNIAEDIPEDLLWPNSLATNGKSIIVTLGNGQVKSFDFFGNLIWTNNFNMNIRTPSYIINDTVFVFVNDGELIGLDVKSGIKQLSFHKDYKKISSIYGGNFYEYRNNFIAVSPKGNIYFIDNFFNTFSDLQEYFNQQFFPLNQDNYDYDVNLSAFDNLIVIIENNRSFSLYDLSTNKIVAKRLNLRENKFFTNINNSIFILNSKNQIESINIDNNKVFWKSDIRDFLEKEDNIVNIIELEKFILVIASNGTLLFLNRLNGTIEDQIKLKIDNVIGAYPSKNYLLFITDKASLHIYK